MTDELKKKDLSRRTMVKGAAWSVPVLATAVAVPAVSASVNNSSLSWTSSITGLLTLTLLDGGGTLSAQALTTTPTEFTLTNGTGPIDETATVTIAVGRPSGLNIPVGRARGFGVASYDGVDSTPAERTASYQSAPIVGQFGFPATTFTRANVPVNVASNGSLAVPVVFGLAGVSTGVAISALASFPVTVTLAFSSGPTLSAGSSISVPVGAGLL